MERQATPVQDNARAGRYSARELAERAGTTVRTIHYYTSEDLLPPPAGSSRNATYTDAHLARLRIIAALRDEGLALGKIRERLTPLTDEQVLNVAAALSEHLAGGDSGPLTTLGLIDLEMTRQNLPPLPDEEQRIGQAIPGPAKALYAPITTLPYEPARTTPSAREYLDRLLRREDESPPAQQRPSASRAKQLWDRNSPPADLPEVWYQYCLDDGVELRLREDRYRQLKGRPGALLDTVRSTLRKTGLLRDADDQEDDAPHH